MAWCGVSWIEVRRLALGLDPSVVTVTGQQSGRDYFAPLATLYVTILSVNYYLFRCQLSASSRARPAVQTGFVNGECRPLRQHDGNGHPTGRHEQRSIEPEGREINDARQERSETTGDECVATCASALLSCLGGGIPYFSTSDTSYAATLFSVR